MTQFCNWIQVIFKNDYVAYNMERRYRNYAAFLGVAPIITYCISMFLLTIKYNHIIEQFDKNIDANSALGLLVLIAIIIVNSLGIILSVVLLMPIILYITYRFGKLSAEEARDIYFYSLYPARWFPGGWRPQY